MNHAHSHQPVSGQAIAASAWRMFVNPSPDAGRVDFFESGGHSMLLLRMAAWIKSEHGRDLVLAEFLKQPTLDGLARCLDGLAASPDVPVQSFGEGPRTIVCVPGSYGRALAFERLAMALDERTDEPVRLVCYELWNTVERLGVHGAIEAVRARLRDDLVRPEVAGVAGYSLGGMFAFLEDFAADRPGLHLWLIDSYPPIPPRSRWHKAMRAALNACRAPMTLPGALAASVGSRAPSQSAGDGTALANSDHPDRWSLHHRLGELARTPWSGETTLIALRRKPLWMPHYTPASMNGLVSLVGSRATRVSVNGPHTELLKSRVEEVAGVLASAISPRSNA